MKKSKKVLYGVLIFLGIYLCPLEVFATSEMDNTVFVLLTHVQQKRDEKLIERCYESVRFFYPDTPVVIIDDNSTIPLFIREDVHTTLIESEFPGGGELLPYYYFLKYKWADKMIFLHDSMFLKRKFTPEELSSLVRFHWSFDYHSADNDWMIDGLLSNLKNGAELIDLNHKKYSWNGCFGVASMIDLHLLEELEEKYAFVSSLIDKIQNRHQRMALERIFALVLFQEKCLDKDTCANFGDIFTYPRCWQVMDDTFLEELKENYPGAILKTWHGR
jgi:hypothetical protein